MKKAFLLVWIFATTAAFAQASYDLGQRLGDSSFLNIPKQRCLTAPNKVEPCLRVRTRGVIYTIGYRPKGRIITYLETHDSTFATADGLRVGSSLNGAAGTLSWANAFGEVVAPGTSDGWQPVVAHDRMLRCDNGIEAELNGKKLQNSGPCQIKILGFKKRAMEHLQSGERLENHIDRGQ
jgi:hypothetical protein